ncbi:MAG: hypothetical protein PVF15_04900 [Candidatus Bathyarchaeota archaeon]
MSERVELEVQGLKVEIMGLPSVQKLKRTAVGVEFPCECGAGKLSVTSANFPMEDWERLTEARRQAEAWNKATEKASDFVDYHVKIEEVRKKFEERFGLLWTGGVLSQAAVACHICKRTYRFEIGVSIPIAAERLSPSEVYQRYSLENTKAFQRTIAEWIHLYGNRHRPLIRTAADYIKYLRELEVAPKTVDRFAGKIRRIVDSTRTTENSVLLGDWLEDFEGSFNDVIQDFRIYCGKRLWRYIDELASLVTESEQSKVSVLT